MDGGPLGRGVQMAPLTVWSSTLPLRIRRQGEAHTERPVGAATLHDVLMQSAARVPEGCLQRRRTETSTRQAHSDGTRPQLILTNLDCCCSSSSPTATIPLVKVSATRLT